MAELGRLAYEAYARHAGNRSLITAQMLPLWPEVPAEIRAAWDAAAAAVAAHQLDVNPPESGA